MEKNGAVNHSPSLFDAPGTEAFASEYNEPKSVFRHLYEKHTGPIVQFPGPTHDTSQLDTSVLQKKQKVLYYRPYRQAAAGQFSTALMSAL